MTEPTATPATRAAIDAMAATLPMGDQQDFDGARRGFVGRASERLDPSAMANLVALLGPVDPDFNIVTP